ncbi:hypothetical protein ACFGVR_11015 [Mucilaginibacter sp. AW1-3]
MLTPDVLSEIKSKLERYHTVHCGLKHERVIQVPSFGSANIVKRYGLCDRPTRRYRLGCAHTLANDEFYRLTLLLGAQFPAAQAMAAELDRLFNYVYIIDIAKGELEKQLAFALSANNDQLIREAKAAISQVIATHHQLITAIEEIRAQLLTVVSSL